MNADGTDVRRLTDSAAIEEYPTWSPDGRRIILSGALPGNSGGLQWSQLLPDLTMDNAATPGNRWALCSEATKSEAVVKYVR
jgi:Tol biopolymer transport system component